MNNKNYLLSLLDFSTWANEEFFKIIRKLELEEINRERDSFMVSIRNSVNHLLVIDKVWMSHMKRETHKIQHLQTILYKNLDDIWEVKDKMNKEIRDYVSNLSDNELEEIIHYQLISGNKGKLPRYMIITHLAMHSAYHRGIIADMFGQIPTQPAGQDIPVWQRFI